MSVTCYLYDRKEKYDVDSLNGREVIIVILPCPPRPIIKWIRQIHMRNKRNIYQSLIWKQQMVKIVISTFPCNERIKMYVSYHCCPVEVHLLHLQSKYKNGLNGWQVPVILHLDTSCYQIFIASFLRNVVKKILQSLRCIRLGWKCIHIHLRVFFRLSSIFLHWLI